ncbi:site-specific DNA-methyltransferase, partial [Klebsiella michiganensis]
MARLTPKPIDLVKRVAVISTQPGDYVLDYFGGTGTTACSILKLNSESNGSAQRRWMLCEMGSVFDVARKRVCRSLFSQSWESQKPKDSGQSGTLGCVKVQTFEQYEDLLDNLQSVWDEASLPKQIPVKYLFRPEQNQLISTLDLSRP